MLTLLALVAGFTADVSPKTRLKNAEAAYDEYRYAQAIGTLQVLFSDPAFTDGPSRQRAHLILAFSEYMSNREADARDELKRLFRENVSYAINRDTIHPDLIHFFDAEHERYLGSLSAAQTSQSPHVTPQVDAPVAERRTLGDRQPWLRIFPLGVGQFANHDYVAGGVFLALEVALVATNVAAAVVRGDLRASDGTFRPQTQPVPWQVVQDAAGIAAIAVGIIGVIDAFVWSPARGRRTLSADLATVGDYRLVLVP